jgi:predicted nucleotidyltransferase
LFNKLWCKIRRQIIARQVTKDCNFAQKVGYLLPSDFKQIFCLLAKNIYICKNFFIAMISKTFILSVIRTHKPQLALFGVNRIGLFGSYVRNEQQPHSDMDILVDFDPEKETFDNFMNLHNYLEELFSNEKVEVVTVKGLSPYIGKHILKEVNYV